MIYRDPERWLDAGAWLRLNRSALLRPDRLAGHDAAVRLLVEFGEIESALTDLLLPAADALLPETAALRRLALRTGQLLHGSWRDRPPPQDDPAAALACAEGVAARFPAPLRVKVAEGFALYGLYPETYLEAAEQFARHTSPGRALCIGLRTIGAPLSAVVAAVLEAAGWEVTPLTLRPRGAPFDRTLVLAPGLERFLRGHTDDHALLIDEGPGLSGSSFACAADALHRLGFPEGRITFFPSWNADPSRLRSPAAQARWPRHRKWMAGFEATWVATGRLSCLPLEPQDQGRWRHRLLAPGDFPPVQPQHERRKYLTVEPAPRLFKFAGLGPYGETACRRAAALAERGFAPRVHALRHGFLIHPFVAGRPLTPRDCNDLLLDHVARYLAWVQRAFPAARRTPGAELHAMAAANVREALGVELTMDGSGPMEAGPAVELDGRMQPWEWLATAQGFLKTDAVDHHADHFFPGATDIAWDLAGFAAEFALDDAGTEQLVRRFVRHGGDPRIAARLPWFRVAYAAFATGYARLARETTAGSPEAERFRRREERMKDHLRRALARPGPR